MNCGPSLDCLLHLLVLILVSVVTGRTTTKMESGAEAD